MAWTDDEPVRGGYPDASLLSLPGLDRMRAGFRQQMLAPPISHLFGLVPTSAGAASTTFSMPASPWLLTYPPLFFAGTAALVADAPLGSAVLAPLGPGQIAVTSDLSMNFFRPINVDSGSLICRARPIEVGNRLGFAEGLVEDGLGRPIAHCTTRCFVLKIDVPPDPGPIPSVSEPAYETPDPYLRPAPKVSLEKGFWDEKSFLEILQMMKDGELPPPPFARLFAIADVDAAEGRMTSTMRCTGWHTSPAGTVYGGVIAYLADTVMTGAFSTTLGAREIVAPLDLKVQFIRPVYPDGRLLTATAEVVHRGRNLAAAQVKIKNAEDKTVALGTSSAVIIGGRSWGSFVVADEAPAPTP